MYTLIGAFETREAAGAAVDDLLAGGFPPDQVSVLGKHGEVVDLTPENETATHIMYGAGIGAAAGAVLTGIVALAVPGVGPLLAMGAWSTLLMGGVVGGLVGFLTAQGIPKEQAEEYAERVRAGAFLVAVHPTGGREVEAEQILKSAGAEGPVRRVFQPDNVAR